MNEITKWFLDEVVGIQLELELVGALVDVYSKDIGNGLLLKVLREGLAPSFEMLRRGEAVGRSWRIKKSRSINIIREQFYRFDSFDNSFTQ